MTQHNKDVRQNRSEQKRGQAKERITDDAPRRRRSEPYKREQVDYNDYLDEALENDWFDDNI